MATVFVPGVALTVLKGMIGSNPWAVTHHWQFGSDTTPWNAGDISNLATNVYNAWGTSLKAQAGGNIDVRECTATDLTNATGVGFDYTHAPVGGTLGGPLEPSSAAVVVLNKIADRYRGGHPRTYWPLSNSTSMATENTWNATVVAAIQTGVSNWRDAIIAGTYTHPGGSLINVVPRFTYTITDDAAHHKYKRTKSGLLHVSPVISYFANVKIGSQRRRLTP